MNWIILAVAALVALLFAGLGWAIGHRKAFWLISGYNMMSSEQQKRVDIEGLGRMMGRWLMGGALIPLAAGVAFALRSYAVAGACFGLLLLWVLAMVALSQRYDGNTLDANGHWTIKTKLIVSGVAALLLAVAGFMTWAIADSNRPVVYALEEGKLRIESSFGTTVALQDMQELQLIDALPPIAARTNGAATDTHLKGSFSLEGGGSARIYARTDAPVYIRFLRGKTLYLLSGETEQQTRELYTSLGGK